MQQAAIQAAKYFEHVEIIELHHNQKADAPSVQQYKRRNYWANWVKPTTQLK